MVDLAAIVEVHPDLNHQCEDQDGGYGGIGRDEADMVGDEAAGQRTDEAADTDYGFIDGDVVGALGWMYHSVKY